MKVLKLTEPSAAATITIQKGEGRKVGGLTVKAGLLMAGTLSLLGCINVTAPEEPIVIQLDINIRAEVLYRLAEDAGNTVEENADIF